MEKILLVNETDEVKDIIGGIKKSFVDSVKDEFVQKKTFSPSTLVFGHGSCGKYWSLAFNGSDWYESVDVKSMDRMNAGTFRHEQIQKALESGPLDVKCEVNLTNQDPPINSYCDVVVDYNGKKIPIEIKTASTEAFEFRRTSLKPAVYHVTQLLIYMYLLDSDIGFLMYEDRNTFDKLMLPVRMTDEYKKHIEYMFDWMRQVYSAYENNEKPKQFKGKRSNSRICKTCPVRQACESDPGGTVDIPLLRSLDK